MKVLYNCGKRLFCAALALILSFAVLTDGYAEQIPQRDVLYHGSFVLRTPDGTSEEEEYFYSDAYFSESGKVFNEHLRTLSAALSFSLCDMADENGVENSILGRIGFSDFTMYDMDHTANDTIGTVIARKHAGESDIVALMLRGYDYENEWASNFSVGETGDAEGFASAASKVQERLRAYLEEHHISSAKIWMTGYSRSAAVANLVGKTLNEHPQDYAVSSDDIYVYTFEAPNCSVDDTVYENIRNTIDCRDPIIWFYPEEWGLFRLGVAEMIGDAEETVMSKRFSIFSSDLSADYEPVGLAEFLSEFSSFLSQNISRQTYAEELEEYVCGMTDMYYSFNEEEREAFSAFMTRFSEILGSDENTFTVVFNVLLSDGSDASYEALADLLTADLDKTREEIASPMSEDQYAFLRSAVHPAVFALKPAIQADINTRKTNADGRNVNAVLYHTMTFIGNFGDIIRYHYNTTVFEQLKAADSYYAKSAWRRVGDADGDGTVSVLDATAIQKHLAKLNVIAHENKEQADVDFDQMLTVIDATHIQKYLAGLGNPHQIDAYLPE